MMRVRVTCDARADLSAIRRYIAADSPRAAAAMLHRLRNSFRRLAVHPELGGTRHGGGPDRFRDFVVRGYSIVYTIEDDEAVVIQRVLGPGQTLFGDGEG